MGFFQWAILGIGIIVIILLSLIAYVIADYVKQSLYYLELIRESLAGCRFILNEFNQDRAREYLKKTENL